MIINGSVSIRRFIIEDKNSVVPNIDDGKMSLGIRRYLFQPINDDRGEKESFGWVNAFDLLNGSVLFQDLNIGDRKIVLGTRKDKKAIPPAILKAKKKEEFARVKAEKKLERLSRQMRIEIEEKLTLELLKGISATTALSDSMWIIDKGVLIVGATGKNAERVAELFESTFDVRVVPAFPGILASYDQDTMAALESDGVTFASTVDTINYFAEYAQDFMTWLLVRTIKDDWQSNANLVSEANSQMRFDVVESIVFQDPNNDREKFQIKGDNLTESPDVVHHLNEGKVVCGMKIAMTVGENTWTTGLDTNFDLKGAKLPVPKLPDEFEFASLRADAILEFFQNFDVLFRSFLVKRRDAAGWEYEKATWKSLEI